MAMEQFLLNNQWLILVAVLWMLPWKGVALWMAARRSHKWWFIVMLLINSLAIIEIIYIFAIGRHVSVEAEPAAAAPEPNEDARSESST